MITDLAAIEGTHVLILERLTKLSQPPPFVVKGGVNLRLFYGSERYSEDMDLDGDANCSVNIKKGIAGIFNDAEFLRKLATCGIGGLDGGQGPNKDTETTYRYKFRVVRPGGVELATRVEVSYRERNFKDEVAEEVPALGAIEQYIGQHNRIVIPHYKKPAAVRQKINALAQRTHAQARDVFDLAALVADDTEDELIRFLIESTDAETLERARDRAFEISYEEYQDQVMEYLTKSLRAEYGSERKWDELRLKAADLIERVRS